MATGKNKTALSINSIDEIISLIGLIMMLIGTIYIYPGTIYMLTGTIYIYPGTIYLLIGRVYFYIGTIYIYPGTIYMLIGTIYIYIGTIYLQISRVYIYIGTIYIYLVPIIAAILCFSKKTRIWYYDIRAGPGLGSGLVRLSSVVLDTAGQSARPLELTMTSVCSKGPSVRTDPSQKVSVIKKININ